MPKGTETVVKLFPNIACLLALISLNNERCKGPEKP